MKLEPLHTVLPSSDSKFTRLAADVLLGGTSVECSPDYVVALPSLQDVQPSRLDRVLLMSQDAVSTPNLLQSALAQTLIPHEDKVTRENRVHTRHR